MENRKNWKIKSLITQTNQPLIIKNYLKWDLFSWHLPKWNELLRSELLEFRCGSNIQTEKPQWERDAKVVQGKFDEIFKFSNESTDWIYFDYKYLNSWFLNIEELRNEINFSHLGFGNIKVDDSTIWIGTKGAHTPCHIDTYGFNIVIQVYGRKRWLLFPPSENLKPTRVPYEESSIYSKLNFFSPTNLELFKQINEFKSIILNPGDVLIVPHKWWHYVENLETSISINTWIPLPQDDVERQKECVVQALIAEFTRNYPEKSGVLNNNSNNFSSSFELLESLMKTKIELDLNRDEDESLLNEFKFVETVKSGNSAQLLEFLEAQSNRFEKTVSTVKSGGNDEDFYVKFVQAITHPDVIDLIRNKLLE